MENFFFSVWDFLFQILIFQSPRYSQINKYKIMIFFLNWINMYILLLKISDQKLKKKAELSHLFSH